MTDPTAVVGRRILAWIIDWAPALALAVAIPASGGTRSNVGSPLAAELLCDAVNNSSSDGCFRINETVYVVEGDDIGLGLLAATAYSLFFIGLLPGVSGWTVGKLAVGLRVVKQATFETAGVGASLLRWLLWIVDAAPFCLPLVGFVTGLATRGHRRVGDMAASTLVVRKEAVGVPVAIAGLAGAAAQLPPGAATWPSTASPPPAHTPGAAPPPPSAPPPTVPPTFPPARPAEPPAEFPPPAGAPAEFPPPPGDPDSGFVAPGSERTTMMPTVGDDEPTTSLPVTSIDEPQPEPEPEPPSIDEPQPEPEPEPPSIDEPQPEPEPEPEPEADPSTMPGVDAPQWDAARNTYIQWDPELDEWMEWDEAGGSWIPIST